MSPKASATPSPSSSDSSLRSVAIDAAGALIATIANADDEVKNVQIKQEEDEWFSPPSERDEVKKSRRSLFVPSDSYSSLDDSNPDSKSEDDFIDRATLEALEPWMAEQAGGLENEVLEKVADAMDFNVTTYRHDVVRFRRGNKTVSLWRNKSTVQLQPHDQRFGSVKRSSLKSLTVFLEAVVRMTTQPGLISLFSESRKRKAKNASNEGAVIPRKVTWAEREKRLSTKEEEQSSSDDDRPSSRAAKEDKHSKATLPLEVKKKMRDAMEKTKEALRRSKEREAKEKKEAKKQKEKQIKKAFALFVDDTDDFIEVKGNLENDNDQKSDSLFTGRVQEEKTRKIRSIHNDLSQSPVLLFMNFYNSEVSKKRNEGRKLTENLHTSSSILSLYLYLYLFFRIYLISSIFLFFFYFSDLRMTKRPRCQRQQSAILIPDRDIFKVNIVNTVKV